MAEHRSQSSPWVEDFEKLYAERYGYFLAIYRLDAMTDELKQQLLEDGFCHAWDKLWQFEGRDQAQLQTWVWRVISSQRVEYFRKHQPTLVSTGLSPEVPERPEGALTNPQEDRLRGQQHRGCVQRVYARFSCQYPDLAEPLHWAIYEDETQAEVATRLDLPLTTVKSRIARAYKVLQDMLKECDDC